MKKGVAISPGVAVARAFRIDEVLARGVPNSLDAVAISAEIVRFDNACNAVTSELDITIERVRHEIGEDAAAIFQAHRMLLRDPALVGKVKTAIASRQVDAITALQDVVDEFEKLFAKIPDEYLRERMSDIRDVVNRLLANLSMKQAEASLEGCEPVILVAPEILPSQAVMFDRLPVCGIITETGGGTGHAAILARALGIPAVSGLRGILREVQTGDMLVIDGREGHVHVNPGPEVEAAYRKLAREYVNLRDRLIENRDQDALSADGVHIDLLANVNNTSDAITAMRVGASGVGLFRTEYLFLTHSSIPDEEEQLAAYRAVIEAAPNKRVTIRTLDLGGDKQVPYFDTHREANPFMGWRSIRMTSDYPEFFTTQLRAILRAGQYGNVSLMFPMISTLEEVQRLRRLVERTRMTLVRQGTTFGQNIPFGIMIEVPAAAMCIDQLLDEVDFVSIGSNDLIQYLMAADRDNPKVAHLCEPFYPAVFRVLKLIISACVARDKPVTLCGEMAGRPRCFLPLMGMGLRRFSMSPAFVPTLKELTRSVTMEMCRQAAEQVVRLRTANEVRGYLTKRVRQLCPNVAMLDTL